MTSGSLLQYNLRFLRLQRFATAPRAIDVVERYTFQQILRRVGVTASQDQDSLRPNLRKLSQGRRTSTKAKHRSLAAAHHLKKRRRDCGEGPVRMVGDRSTGRV